jgi:hypothetical protein
LLLGRPLLDLGELLLLLLLVLEELLLEVRFVEELGELDDRQVLLFGVLLEEVLPGVRQGGGRGGTDEEGEESRGHKTLTSKRGVNIAGREEGSREEERAGRRREQGGGRRREKSLTLTFKSKYLMVFKWEPVFSESLWGCWMGTRVMDSLAIATKSLKRSKQRESGGRMVRRKEQGELEKRFSRDRVTIIFRSKQQKKKTCLNSGENFEFFNSNVGNIGGRNGTLGSNGSNE